MIETSHAALKTEREVETKLVQPLFREVLGYPNKGLHWDEAVQLTFGTEKKTKKADLVVYHNGDPVIAVEAKKPTEAVQSGLDQVDSYAFALRTPYSVITNGRHLVLRGYYSGNSRINVLDESINQLHRGQWSKLKNLISFSNIRDSLKEPANLVRVPDEVKIKDFRRFFRKVHSEIRDRDKLDPAAAFDELSKLLFLKAAEDDWQQGSRMKPVLTPEKIEEWESLGNASELVNSWFKSVVAEHFSDVFEEKPGINLSIETLKEVLRILKNFHVRDGEVDVKGRAFEEFLPSQLRGEGLGQYFTPRPIVNFMAEIAGVEMQDVVVDFSCGSGGFLIKAFDLMRRRVEEMPSGLWTKMGTTSAQVLDEIREKHVFGIDAEPRAARTAKMNMLMWGDGRRVVRGNALARRDFSGKAYVPAEYDEKRPTSGCTLILANPPFGSKEKDVEILGEYMLGSRLKTRKSENTETLFLEKGVRLLRPEGRMLIVIPQGLMSGSSNDRVRDFLHSEVEIRAIVSLPTHAFVQSGVPTVNTCVLYVQKFTKEKKRLYDLRTKGLSPEEIRTLLRADAEFDYPIFMGTSEFIGYEPSGRMIVKPGEKTDLDLLVVDFDSLSAARRVNVDLFEFASRHYGEKSTRRRDQTVRGTTRGLKTSLIVKLSETQDRLDPPFYLLRLLAGPLIDSLEPLGTSAEKAGPKFRPKTEDELDTEYPILSVSSDGKVTLGDHIRGEDFTQPYRRVHHNDFVYNPSRVNIGSIGLVPKELDGSLVSPEYVVFRCKKLDPGFLLNLLRCPFYRMYIDVITTGSIRDRLYFEDLQSIRVPDVSKPVQIAVCEQSRRVEEELENLLVHATLEKNKAANRLHGLVATIGEYVPVPASTESTFRLLADQWRMETGMLSSSSKKAQHPAYQKIIAMKQAAVPLILREMAQRPEHWFAALHAITGESPTPETERSDLRKATDAWLRWGRSKGYVK